MSFCYYKSVKDYSLRFFLFLKLILQKDSCKNIFCVIRAPNKTNNPNN